MKKYSIIICLLCLFTLEGTSISIDTVSIDRAIEKSFSYLSTNPDSAIIISTEQVPKTDDDKVRKARLFWIIGIAHQQNGNIEEALRSEKEGLSIVKGLNNKLESRITAQLAFLYFGKDDLINAINFYEQALDLAIKAKEEYMIAYIQTELGRIYYSNENLDNAIFYGEKAYEYYKKNEIERGLIDVLGVLGLSWLSTDSTSTQAKKYLFEAYTLSISQNDSLKINLCKNNYATALLKNGKVDEAFKLFSEAESFLRGRELKTYMGPILINLGTIYLLRENLGKAEATLHEGLNYALELKQNSFIISAYNNLTQLYEKSGDEFKVLENRVKLLQAQKKLNKLKDEAFNNDVTILHDLKLEQMENEILQAKNDASDEKIKSQRIVNVVVSIGFVFIAILLTFAYFSQKKIKRQKEQLDSLNQTKDKIISILSHDLRAPLTQIVALQKMMSSLDIDVDKKKELEDKLIQRTEQSLNMLEGILSWAKNALNNNAAQINTLITELVDDTITELNERVVQKHIQLDIDVEDTLIETNPELLKIVLRNLISNAVKFTHEKGRISITGTKRTLFYEIRIKDTGVGFGENILKDINSKSSRRLLKTINGTLGEKGNGLGLVLSKDFIVTLGGSLSIEQTSLEGSTLLIQLPLM